MLQDALKQWQGNIFRVNRDRDPPIGTARVKKPGMAASLMMNVKTASQERTNYFLGFEDGEFFCHREVEP